MKSDRGRDAATNENKPTVASILLKLQLTYREADQEKTLYLGLNENDLYALRDTVNRALEEHGDPQVLVLHPDGPSQPPDLLDSGASGRRTVLARQLLSAALERYRRPDGYEGDLVEAAWQLEQIGWEAWPVLQELVLAGTPECEYFLAAVVRLEGVAPQQRLTALLAAARNPDANVRSRLLELLEEMPDDLRRAVLREMTAQDRPDDGVTDRALEVWHEQAS